MAAIVSTGALVQNPVRKDPYKGIWSWLTTVDAKRIGILYGGSAIVFFIIAGIEAEIMRIQLIQPGMTVVSSDTFNQLFTMHGTVMIFLVIMPMGAAFFNYIVPLMIGARDVAFPRLNALSYWFFIAGGIVLHASFIFGGAPNVGWFGYANLTELPYSPGHGVDYWIFGLQLLGFASLAASFNFMITIINMRAPGMTLLRMPVFAWMTLVTTFLLILAFPVLTVALVELMFDRFFGANFFNPAGGANPLVWVHLFWIFGHPEVYILILPALGMISEIVATFSRKPLFGYPVIVFSGVAIAFLGFGVWAHHMFSVGMGPIADAVFAIVTMIIAIPTGVKIFNWVGTMWGGSINVKAPFLYVLAFIFSFIIGGISGVMHASPPADLQQHGSYFVVAHIHYVLYGGSIFGLMAGMHYWYPKYTGRMMNEKLSQFTAWFMWVSFNVTFFPMHFTGLLGMPRRYYTYDPRLGVTDLNVVSTLGAIALMVAVGMFLYNAATSMRRGQLAGNDPWDGATLEWSTTSPPPVYNFATIPPVLARDAFWALKYPEGIDTHAAQLGKGVLSTAPIAGGEPEPGEEHGPEPLVAIHMPRPSYWPLVIAIGLTTVMVSVIYSRETMFAWYGVVFGLMCMFTGVFGWASEQPGGEPEYVPLSEVARTRLIPGQVRMPHVGALEGTGTEARA